MSETEYMTIRNAHCIHATPAAILVRIGEREVWIPQSVVGDDSEVYRAGDKGSLVVAEWFAERHEL